MIQKSRSILLSFDVEEFDMPLEYGHHISLQEQLTEGFKGLQAVMQMIGQTGIRATFFTTANFACHYPNLIKSLAADHEIASHTYFHSEFKLSHLVESRLVLEKLIDKPVLGLRMPRMMPVKMEDVKAAGYIYDSSINPTWIPGRYNNLHLPRNVYIDNDILRVPASVSPHFRIPLFWLAFKNMPYGVFKYLVKQTLVRDGHVCLYLHPWEFTDIDKYQIPGYAKRWSGELLCERLIRLIEDLSDEGEFITMYDFLKHNFIQPD
ncbi:polysaccharide deacetylase family protein [Chitinophaga sp.]|uniref:polysaccharide deacetylase family protein n=1 Tax=Chitinophaga sp. TaxID=1869181 RepID=UPI0031DEE0C4